MSTRAHHSEADAYLRWAINENYIQGYERLENMGRVRWKIETIPTRYNTFHKVMDSEPIVLTTREVMAFIEGLWAGAKIHPTRRAGDPIGPVGRQRQAANEERERREQG